MATAFWAVHSSVLRTVSVVEKFGRKTGQHGSFLGFELERGHGRSVLAEIDNECFARTNGDGLAGGKLLYDVHLAILIIGCACCAFPRIGFDGRKREVVTEVYLSTVRWEQFALEFCVEFRLCKCCYTLPSLWQTCVVVLAVEDGSMGDWACNACFPVFLVCAEEFFCAVGISQFHNASEGNLLACHAFLAAKCDDFVCPPAGNHLHCEHILLACSAAEGFCDVVGEGYFRLFIVSETGFQDFFAYEFPVDVQLVSAKAGRHPASGLHLLAALECGDKPACTIGSTGSVVDFSSDNLCICCAEPCRLLPCGLFERLRERADCLLCIACQGAERQCCK